MDKVRRWPLLLGAAVLACGGSVGSDPGVRHTPDPSGRPDAGSGGGASSLDGGATHFDCPSSPPTSEKGEGLCAAPAPPTPPGSRCACLNVAGAPGVDACPPSSAAEYGTPCCSTGSCAFDFGNGCTTFPLALPHPVAPVPACGAPPSTPGLLASGYIQTVVANTTSVYFLEIANDVFSIVRIGKSDCARTSFSAEPYAAIEATESGLFVVTSDGAGQASLAEIPEGAGAQVPVPLSSLLGEIVSVEALGSDGKSLYAVIAQADPNNPMSYRHVLIEVPCCGEAPKLLAVSHDDAPGFVGDARLVRDGGFVYWVAIDPVLDAGPITTLVRFNLSTGGTEIVLHHVRQYFPLFDAVDGVIYLGGDNGISALRLPGCLEPPLLEGRLGQVTALTRAAGTLFWAETTTALAFSQIFSRPLPGGTQTRIVDTPGSVAWLSVDATHVYWLATLDVGGSQLLRMARP